MNKIKIFITAVLLLLLTACNMSVNYDSQVSSSYTQNGEKTTENSGFSGGVDLKIDSSGADIKFENGNEAETQQPEMQEENTQLTDEEEEPADEEFNKDNEFAEEEFASDEEIAEDTEYVQLYYFRNKSTRNSHFEKHGAEFGGQYKTAEEYETGADKAAQNPNALHKTEKEDGDDVYYIEATNEFVVVSKDGYIRTYFKPSAGKKYYDRQ